MRWTWKDTGYLFYIVGLFMLWLLIVWLLHR